MARTSRAERHRRRESALALVSQGKGFSNVVDAQMAQWGALTFICPAEPTKVLTTYPPKRLNISVSSLAHLPPNCRLIRSQIENN